MDSVKYVIASAVRLALATGGGGPQRLVSWKYEITYVSALETQIKVWPDETKPPRYFTVKVSEAQ